MNYGKWTYCGDDADRYNSDGTLKLGFVYVVTERSTGRFYHGKKQVTRIAKLPPLKGKKRKRRVVKETDWRKYKTSSTTIVELCEEHGEEWFDWEILSFHDSKSMLSWVELKHQVSNDCLRNDDSFNGIINIRLSKIKED